MFKDDLKSAMILPTMYMLFERCPSYSTLQPNSISPIKIFLKLGVENFIFNGADLMWPGIVNVEITPTSVDATKEFKQGQMAVIYAYNGSIVVPDDTEQSEKDKSELAF